MKPILKTVEEMMEIANRPRSSEERQRNMDDLYETAVYFPEVEPAPTPPHDEAGDLLD